VARTPTAPGVGVLLGDFEPTALLERLRQAGATESEGGLRMELGSRTLALQPTPRGLLFGGVDEVAQTRAAIEAGRTRLDLEHLEVTLAALPRSAAAWGVLGAEALTSASALAAGSRLPLPPLPPLRGAGLALEVEAMPTLDVVVLAEDEQGARRFAETAAGAIAVAQMTAAPEWRELLSELALGREESTVRLRLRIPTDRLEALADRLRPES
jgi:hypothetical protein